MKEIAIKDIVLKGSNRSVMSETGLPAETQVEYLCRHSRWGDTEYSTSLYRIVDTDDLLIIQHTNPYDNVVIKKGYFKKQKVYARNVSILARSYNLPFELALALGDKESNYEAFTLVMLDLDSINLETVLNLNAGSSRRKSSLHAILGEELYDSLHIKYMGRINTRRIANYVAKCCMAKLS